MTLLLTILAFGVMIFVHELGHYVAARLFGVDIEKFSIGFGKPILQWQSKGVQWRLGWIPLGGYLKLRGENPDEQKDGLAGSFQSKPWWQKALIGFSGPFANLLLGVLLFIVSFLLPLKISDQRPVIARAEGLAARYFAAGDSIQNVNGKQIRGFGDFLENLSLESANKITVIRGGQAEQLTISPSELDSLLQSVYPAVRARVGEVIPKTPAYHAQLKPGDEILMVDGVEVTDWYAMRNLVISSGADSVSLLVKRGGQLLRKDIRLESSLSTGSQKAIGIMQEQPVTYVRHFSLGEALSLGLRNSLNFVSMNYQMLYKLLLNPSQLKKNVGGPVMIVSLSQQVGSKGFSYSLLFFASISLMLMIMNLLPIPILDGGLILFACVEGLIGRPIPSKVQTALQSIGFMLLMLLMVLAFYSDISSEVLRYLSK